MSDFVKSPCKSCPFRRDKRPFLHPERAAQIAYAAYNPYNDFICHNTIEYDGEEDHQGRPTGDFSRQKTCAGFLTLRADYLGTSPLGFTPAVDVCYDDADEMYQAYFEEWNKKQPK